MPPPGVVMILFPLNEKIANTRSRSGSMFQETRSESMKIEFAPRKVTGLTPPMKVSVGARTSSPALSDQLLLVAAW